jgi:homocitrate synthase
LAKLKDLEQLVADVVEVNIPFNNPITGFCAFTHKAGIHAKAILNNPSTYEILNPADFGLSRYVHFASRLTGWNAIKSRAEQLGYEMTDEEYKQCTIKIKALADVKKMGLDDTDAIIRSFHKMVTAESPRPVKSANVTNGAVKGLEALDLNGAASGDSNGHAEVPPPTEQMKEFLATEKA